MIKNLFHTIAISSLVYIVIFLGSLIPLGLGGLNPFNKSISDYEATDLVFCNFKNQICYDDRIVVINVGKPNRVKIAKALFKLDSLDVMAIGVDVVFEKYEATNEDSILLSAIQSNNKIVLADEYDIDNSKNLPHVCNSKFCNKSNIGFTNFVAKPNHSIRYFLPTKKHNSTLLKSYASHIVEKADKLSFEYLSQRGGEVEQINYRGIGDSYVQIEIDDFIEDDFTAIGYSEKIVLLGYLGDDQWSISSRDKYFTPMNNKIAMKTAPDMFGVLIHANVISMILDRNYINESAQWINRLLCVLLVILFVAIFRTIFFRVNPGYWKVVRMIQIVIFFCLFLFSTLLFYIFNLKLGIGVALLGVALSWDMVKIYENIFIKKQKFLKPKL